MVNIEKRLELCRLFLYEECSYNEYGVVTSTKIYFDPVLDQYEFVGDGYGPFIDENRIKAIVL